jgi:sugar phosphate isomerase/epimerase
MGLSRRNMLKLGLGAAAVWATGMELPGAEPKRKKRSKKIPIALQVYSVRDACAKDVAGVLKAVAKMGYQGIEFAGYYGKKAEELRKILDDNNLKCCGTHIGLDTLLGDALKKTVEFNKTLGNPFLIVSWMPAERLDTVEHITASANLFTELAEKVKGDGMRVGYHAHGGDFRKVEGQTAWDLFFGKTGPEVTMQLDIGNCIGGGGDPYAILKKFPGRSATIHLKEHGGKPGACVGDGDVKWKEVFEFCETTGKTEWYIVEQEAYAGSPLDSVKKCVDNLRKMGK